jgi:CYTH domain-containing protein
MAIKKKVKFEIERKFILKRLPVELFKKGKFETLFITQYYFNINGRMERFRIATNIATGKTKYIRTLKKSVQAGINEEDEGRVSKKEFKKVYAKNKDNGMVIEKIRYIIKHKDLKFEIDDYKTISKTVIGTPLFTGAKVVMEVELPTLDHQFEYPAGLFEEIVIEATGIKQFSNYSLSIKHEPGKLFFKQHE